MFLPLLLWAPLPVPLPPVVFLVFCLSFSVCVLGEHVHECAFSCSGVHLCCVWQVRFAWDITGLDPDCLLSGPDASVPLSCGIHIHSGTSCGEGTGAHFYNPAIYSESPWLSSQYTSQTGVATTDFGYDFSVTEGRAFVLHDRTGARVTCTLINTQQVLDVNGFDALYMPSPDNTHLSS